MIPGSRGRKSSCKQACIGFLTFCPDIIIKYVSEEKGWDNMPSTYAHYIFGQQIRGRLSGYERKVIDKYPELFNIGLHGPDILFYYRPLGKNKVNQLGSRIHNESGAKFFVHAAKALHTHDQYEKHLAYVYGVLCHFALDEICHGYVEQAVKETGLAHIAVEGELDRKLMIMNGENPVSRRLTGHIVPSMKNAIIIKDFYGYCG